MRFVNLTRGTTLAERGLAARTWWARFKGLLGRSAFPEGEGLLIEPCADIHMFFMRFAIDVVFLDRSYRVTRIATHVKPWRVAFGGAETYATLELPDGTVERTGTQAGDKVGAE